MMNKRFTRGQFIVLSLLFFVFCGLILAYFVNVELSSTAFSPRSAILARFDTEFPIEDPEIDEDRTLVPISISNDEVISPIKDRENEGVLYYLRGTGKTIAVDLTTKTTTKISGAVLRRFIGTIWAPNTKEAVSVFNASKGHDFRYFNFLTKESRSLGEGVVTAVFSPESDRLAFVRQGPDASGIYVSQPNGKNEKLILATRLDKVNLFWPSPLQLVLTSASANGLDLFYLSLDGQLEKIISDTKSLEVKWSKDGSRLLFSRKNNQGELELLVKKFRGTDESLPITTRASHCAWSIDQINIWCLVKQERDSGVSLVKANTDTLAAETIKEGLIIEPKEVLLTNLENYLVVLTQANYLFSIRLP